jgi:hypothetical protein
VTYVFDTNAFGHLFHSYYRGRFPSLWANYDVLVGNGSITSTREVYREIDDGPVEGLRDWAKANKRLFPTPTADEGLFIAQIFSVEHFQQVIEQKKLLKGGKNADPFIVARAAVIGGTVVTMEKEPQKGAKIPNIWRHFGIPCVSLEGFMEAEGWEF